MNIQEFFSNWGGVIGSVGGILGGLFGTYCSIRGTNGPKERAFMLKAAIWTWIFIGVLLGLTFGLGYVLPPPYKSWTPLVVVLIVPALLIGIPACNRRLAQIRAEEAHVAGRDEGKT